MTCVDRRPTPHNWPAAGNGLAVIALLAVLSGCDSLNAFGRRFALSEHLNQAARAHSENRLPDMLVSLDRVLKISPDDPLAHQLAARVALRRGDDGQTRRHMQYVPATAWSAEEATLFGTFLSQRGHLDEAVTLFEKVGQAYPQDWTLENGLAYTLVEGGGDLDRALQLGQDALTHFESALADPLGTGPWRWFKTWSEQELNRGAIEDTVGWAYYRMRDFNRALTYLDRAAQRSPDRYEIRFHRAMVLIALERRQQGAEELRATLRLRPQYRIARILLQRLTGEDPRPAPRTWVDFLRQFAL